MSTALGKKPDPLEVLRNSVAEKKVAEIQKVQFSNDGTLESWLEKIVSLNKLQFSQTPAKLTLKHDYLAKARTMYEHQEVLLKDLGYLPSFSQFACALIAEMLFTHHKRILLSIPPGKGKSRVVCALATLFARQR